METEWNDNGRKGQKGEGIKRDAQRMQVKRQFNANSHPFLRPFGQLIPGREKERDILIHRDLQQPHVFPKINGSTYDKFKTNFPLFSTRIN